MGLAQSQSLSLLWEDVDALKGMLYNPHRYHELVSLVWFYLMSGFVPHETQAMKDFCSVSGYNSLHCKIINLLLES